MILKQYKDIFLGRKAFYDFVRNNKLKSDDYMLILPDDDRKVSCFILLYLDFYLQYIDYVYNISVLEKIFDIPVKRRVFVISSNKDLLKLSYQLSNNISGAVFWKTKTIENITKYYLACNPPNILHASIEKLNGRNCAHLIGRNGIDLEKIVCYGIYGISHNYFNEYKPLFVSNRYMQFQYLKEL